ncbi:hypothetical protein LCGC14_2646970, partial [marine sediment metagenome]
SKTDPFWGIGKKGNGKNMLGKLLMKVRKEIRKCMKCEFYNDLMEECEAYVEDPLNCNEFIKREEMSICYDCKKAIFPDKDLRDFYEDGNVYHRKCLSNTKSCEAEESEL